MDLTTAQGAAAGTYAALAASRGQGSLQGLLAVLKGVQGVRNVLDAVEAETMAQVAAIEVVGCEDGTLGERHHGIGHQEMDAPELVAPCLGVSVHVAAARMTTALALVTRTPALVTELAAGRLGGSRARVVVDELAEASEATSGAVVAELIARAERAGGWHESAGPLRRSAAAVLGRIDAEAVRARAREQRARRGLSRQIESTSLDRWEGFYPVEESRLAWEAIDTRAREILAAGEADTLGQARADAHLQLLLAQVSATIHLHPTLPAGQVVTTEEAAAALVDQREVESLAGVVELAGYGGHPGAQVPAAWLVEQVATGRAVVGAPVTCDPHTGAARSRPRPKAKRTTVAMDDEAETTYRPSDALLALVILRDGHCRFPGCAVAARFCDLDHVRPWPTGPTRRDNLLTLCRRHHRIKQKLGWRVRLRPDGTAEWFFPDGRRVTTHPVDHLAHTRPLVLPLTHSATGRDDAVAAARGGRRCEFDEPYDLPGHSPLVEHLARILRDHDRRVRATRRVHRRRSGPVATRLGDLDEPPF